MTVRLRSSAAVLALAGALVVAAPAAADSGPARSRIVGGGPTPIGQLPHQVAVLGSDGVSGTLCGGAIRDETHVITAAHCVYDSPIGVPLAPVDPGRVTVRAGSDRFASGGQAVGVSRVAVEPSYPSGGADVAVLTLSAALELGPAVQPATLSGATPVAGTPATVSGWGTTSGGGSTSSELRSVGLGVSAREACTRAYGRLAAWALCAGSRRDGEDACQGDSGGPLSVRDEASPAGWRLVGIVSSGHDCGKAAFPGIYTDVARVRGLVGAGVAPRRPDAPSATTRATFAPVARVRGVRCGAARRGARRCVVRLKVADADGATGTVRVSGRAQPTCSGAQRARRACPRSRTLSVRRRTGTRTWFDASRTLPAGRWTLRFSARDAGGVQPTPTRKVVRVRR